MELPSDNVSTPAALPQLRKEKGYFCSQCDQCFETPMLLRKHYRSHTDLPFKCHVCGQGFADFISRREHILQHRAERRLKCSDCGRSFDDIPAIDSHRCRGSVIEPNIFDVTSVVRLLVGKIFSRIIYPLIQKSSNSVVTSVTRSIPKEPLSLDTKRFIVQVEI